MPALPTSFFLSPNTGFHFRKALLGDLFKHTTTQANIFLNVPPVFADTDTSSEYLVKSFSGTYWKGHWGMTESNSNSVQHS